MARPPRYRISTDSLRYAMRRAGFSGYGALTRLAEASGIRAQTVGDWLSGATGNPPVSAIMQVACVLGCDVEDLMEEDQW